MFKGICTLLKAEKGEFKKEKTGEQVVYYRGAILTAGGDVIKVSMTENVFNVVKTLTAQSIVGQAELILKTSQFNGKESLKAYLISFTPNK